MDINLATLTTRFETALIEAVDFILKNPAYASQKYPRTDSHITATSIFARRRFLPSEINNDAHVEHVVHGFVAAIRGVGGDPKNFRLVGFKVIGDEIDVVVMSPGLEAHGRKGGSDPWGWGSIGDGKVSTTKTFAEGLKPNPTLAALYEKEADRNSRYAG